MNNDCADQQPYLGYRCHCIQFLYYLGHRTVVRLYRHYLERSKDTWIFGDWQKHRNIETKVFFSHLMILDTPDAIHVLLTNQLYEINISRDIAKKQTTDRKAEQHPPMKDPRQVRGRFLSLWPRINQTCTKELVKALTPPARIAFFPMNNTVLMRPDP